MANRHIEIPHMETFDCEVDQTLCNLLKRNGQLLMNASYYYQTKNDKACKGRWELSNSPIGEISANATVYLSLCEDDYDFNAKKDGNRYIAKIMKPNHPSIAMKEIRAQIEISNSTCKVYTIPISQAFVNEDETMFIIIMPFVEGMTVKRYIERYIEMEYSMVIQLELISNSSDKDIKDIILEDEHIKKIIEQCRFIVTKIFYVSFYIHSDTHLNNFMIDVSGDWNTIKLIDFGKAEGLKNPRDIKDDDKIKLQHDLDMIDASLNKSIINIIRKLEN